MNSEGMITRLFLGFQLTSGLRSQLMHSSAWKKANLDLSSSDRSSNLSIIQYQSREYLGMLLDRTDLSLSEVFEIEKQLQQELLSFCPTLNVDELTSAIFPQQYVI